MKELTIEQKSKAYDKALEKAKKLYEQGTITESLSYVFPELKESEDERIRKELIEFLDELSKLGKNTNFDRWSKSDCADWICWLEKQGETYTKKDIDNAYLEGMAFAKDELEKQNKQILANSAKTCKDEQQPTDNDMKELLHTEYEKGRADAIAEMQKPVDCIDCTNSKGCINCEDGNMKETLVQKPAWSEEDEEFLRRAINATKDVYPVTAKWLKFLKDRVQPKQEWSKKDNQYLCGLIGLIEQSKAELPITLKGKAADNCIDWLKSLKQRIGE